MFYVKVAGMTVGIDEKYPDVRQVCQDYIVPFHTASPLFTVRAEEKELQCMTRSVTWKKLEPGEAENMVIMRKIALRLPEYKAFLLHACVIQCRGMTIAFSAPRGVGKTTHARMWLEMFGDEARILNGDKPLVRISDEVVSVYGTPWSGKEGLAVNAVSRLSAIVFLGRGDEPKIEKLSVEESARMLISSSYIPVDEEGKNRCIPILAQVVSVVPAFAAQVNLSEDSVKTIYEKVVAYV